MISIVDYGLGNIKAFANVYKKLNISFIIATKPVDFKKAEKVILPGVGAFDYAMERLNKSGMRQTLDEIVLQRHVPVLGICVGMQMLARSSEEGTLPGLGWIDGGVKTVDQAQRIFGSGVEKVALSAAAIDNPGLVSEAAKIVGSQSVIVVLDVKKCSKTGEYEAWTHNGQKNTGKYPAELALQMEGLGAGEIVINSIDNDGIIGAAAGSLFVFKGIYRAVLINYPNKQEKASS